MTCLICELGTRLSKYHDTGTIFNDVLRTAISTCNASAGTIYIKKKKGLFFVWSENSEVETWSKLYPEAKLAVDDASLAGYVSISGEKLVLPNIQELTGNEPYKFNPEYDRLSGFKTISAATLPIFGERNSVSGVIQILNGEFNDENITVLEQLAALAGKELRRVEMGRQNLLRMLRMAALRDPGETASHVRRVGYIASEIRTAFGEAHGEERQSIIEQRDNLFYAAMLHDIGKVGISDLILKKPGRFTDEERFEMEKHSALGAQLFDNNSELFIDKLCLNVILHHHQRFDGKGYPREAPLEGRKIPLEARIVAIADVYDALVSKRCYKDAYGFSEAMQILIEGRGTQFDPDLLDLFIKIQPRIAENIDEYDEDDYEQGKI